MLKKGKSLVVINYYFITVKFLENLNIRRFGCKSFLNFCRWKKDNIIFNKLVRLVKCNKVVYRKFVFVF